MKNRHFTRVSLGCLLCMQVLLSGSCTNIVSDAMQAKYQRAVQLLAPLPVGSTFATETHNGSITINGANVADCNMTATIVARAGNEEDAMAIAEKTKITLEPSRKKLTAKIEKPKLKRSQSVTVNIDVIVPNQTDLKLVTHNGPVAIVDVTGKTNATTHNGKVTAEKVSGATSLRTHNGSVTCGEIAGDTQLRTHNGDIKAFYSRAASSTCDVLMTTHNGSIEFAAPPGFSAQVEVSTHNGSVKTDLPITVIGKVDKSKLTGTIGTGHGKLYLETHNGSIRIR